MTKNRIQLSLWLGLALFLIASLFVALLYFLIPDNPVFRGPLLLASFIAVLVGAVLLILFLLRWLLRPYHQLVGEAERASMNSIHKANDEAEFVLETFQSVVAQLEAQRKELQKLSELARERADSAERFNERIVASVPSGLVAFDGSGRATVINAPGRRLLDVNGQLFGQTSDELLVRVPQLASLVRRCLETGKLFRREELDAFTKDGSRRWIGATVAPIELPAEHGSRGVLCLITDITEVTQLREQVALKKNLESLGEMSAGLAHEFKNNIAALHGYVQLLQNLDLDQAGRVATDSLLNEVRNLSEMVSSFLNFARPQPLQLETVSLVEVLGDCVSELEALSRERAVKITTNLARGESAEVGTASDVVNADERMLRQALLNLIRNAIEAIPEEQGSRCVNIRLTTETDPADNRWAVTRISDTGPGIPPSDLQRIFIPFFTTKASGHGVGLALAYRVITQHGGSLEAANIPEGGAVFTARLPA
ncbi:MAG TPA: ATP-binding protein [Pyrinomonadaceae bacterium]|nr:ATP-binding protein [Pyrinomonadaceae bacterium]